MYVQVTVTRSLTAAAHIRNNLIPLRRCDRDAIGRRAVSPVFDSFELVSNRHGRRISRRIDEES